MKQISQHFRETLLPAILNSYSVIFFFNNRLFSAILILVSFFNFYAGLSGFIAVVFTVLLANAMELNKTQLRQGLFSFNALLAGIGMGTYFDPSAVYFSLLILASLLSLILSVTLGGWLNKYGLPVLSIPFVVTFWFILLPSSQFENLGLTQRNIYWINEMYSMGGNQLLSFFHSVDNLPLPIFVSTFFKSLSSIFFQENIIAGFLIAIAILICSRIVFSLTIIGFLSAYFFAQFTGSETASITYYNIGANYLMVAIAIGGFFVIPSRLSYLWAILLVPLTSLVLLFMNKLFGFIQLPVFSLPFSMVVIFFVYFLQMRFNPSKLILTPVQHYSPETNLYSFLNNKERLSHMVHFPLFLPFWGEWTVSQGYNGKHTHKGDWGNALDFMIYDEKGKTYQTNGLLCEDYYCYKKPILAPADGYVELIADNIDDNEIGKVNTNNNWGNTIIIRHLNGLYTQMSHLKRGSFKVSVGEFVRQGDLLALCGNSGRSPEPHLHYQVQTTPALGSKTISYPFAYFTKSNNNASELFQFSNINEGDIVAGITCNNLIKNAFDIMPTDSLLFSYVNQKGAEVIEKWESFTDAYNQKYLYCKQTESSAYYVNDGSMFYFTAFYGNKKTLLYYFHLSAFKIFMGDFDQAKVTDALPLSNLSGSKLITWLHDFIAPFHHFLKLNYTSAIESKDALFDTSELKLTSAIDMSFFRSSSNESKSTITLSANKIAAFEFKTSKLRIQATCIN